jgi:DNA-binding NarL/FixJ family response regulator
MIQTVVTTKISAEQPLKPLLLQYPHLILALHLLGLHGAYGELSIHDVCKEKNINESFLVSFLAAYTDKDFVMDSTLPAYSVLQLTELTRDIYPYTLEQLDLWANKKTRILLHHSGGKNVARLKLSLTRCRQQTQARYDELIRTVLPHIANVYELYYSPEYTSGKSNILQYSLDFFPKNVLPEDDISTIVNVLEGHLSTGKATMNEVASMYDLYRFLELLRAQDRLEQALLKPLVMQMEDSITTTFQKKKIWNRSTYLSLPEEEQTPEVLSPREKEVLQLVAQGLINKEIADQLHIGLTTVISHRKNIVGKLGITTLAGLTVYAYTHGYLDNFILTNED